MISSRGFTILEVLIAIVVMSIGLLASLGTGALTTRTIARGQRSAVATNFAVQRLERLAGTGAPNSFGCVTHTSGVDTLFRSGTWVAIDSWSWTDLGSNRWKVSLTVTYKTAPGSTRADNLAREISCVP
jgi:prepilin-type N-terminal cleavage/methylation domain-containing protein